MVKINTRDFGAIEIDDKKIYDFPNGIFAFEEVKRLALISPLGDNVYPMWLQSTESLTPCFIVFDPSLIDMRYRLTLTESERRLLKVKDNTNLKLLALASVPEDYRDTTVNMKSPIVINTEEGIAAQVILPANYDFRLPIYRQGAEEAGVS